MFEEAVAKERDELRRSEDEPLRGLVGQERRRLERRYAQQCRRRDIAVQRAQLGILDGAALEAGAEAARAKLRADRAGACEASFEALRTKQAEADEAAKQRWLAMAVMSVGTASRFGITAGGEGPSGRALR